MIEIFITERDAIIWEIRSIGHSKTRHVFRRMFREKEYYDALCASVSILEYTFLNTIKGLHGVQYQDYITKGKFTLTLTDIPGKDKVLLQHFSRFMLTGLALIASRHKAVSLFINEVYHGT